MIEYKKPDHEAWSSYPETLLILPGEPEIMIDLREPISGEAKKALKAIGLDSPFAVLTSFNPRGVNQPAEENARLFGELESELRGLGLEYSVIDACSPNKDHCECSVAMKIDRQAAIDMAFRWEQVAIFWWDLERFWIYGAITPIEPISLPLP
ncbi:MAG: DUF3293 domain-containing protein [Gemmatimonadaceae bacterium]